ncbi:MAG: hypothetical protein JRS35_27795, partial [Deltaproteobacteria bacterium]|nr:hypothetical protein [Deltaproteobacteria bacterium]
MKNSECRMPSVWVESVPMQEEENLVENTCRRFLTAAQLKDICRYRGFAAFQGDKSSLATSVGARFLEPAGVCQAMLSLEEPFAVVLHQIALSESPPFVRDLGRILHPPAPGTHPNYDERKIFNELGSGLLNRGIVLALDTGYARYSGESRFARIQLLIPESHRALLPPFPAVTAPLGEARPGRGAEAFCRQALILAVHAGNAGKKKDTGLLERVASMFSIREGELQFDGAAPSCLDGLMRRTRKVWIGRPASSKAGRSKSGRGAAMHIFDHLPEGEGITVQSLTRALKRLAMKTAESELARFCEGGCQAGFLVRGGPADLPCYRAAPDAGIDEVDQPLLFTADKDGIQADLDRSGLDSLLKACGISRVAVAGGTLRLEPDMVRMGRQAEKLDSAEVGRLRAASAAFDRALRHVCSNRGKMIVHEGLTVLRVDDLGLRAQLCRQFRARIRQLNGPYLAIPRALAADVERFARKEGFVPRRV